MSYHLTNGIEFLKSLPDQSVDGIFTDPPWGIRVGTHAKGHRSPKLMGAGNWLELIKQMTEEGARVLKPDGSCLIWLGMRHVGDVIKTVTALEYRWMFFCYYIPSRYIAGFESCLDPILYFSLPNSPWPKSAKNGQRRIRSLYRSISTGKKNTLHPCARPFRTVKDILRDWFDEDEYVVDPFAGSDTVGTASRELNLKYDTCEIDPMMYLTGKERNRQKFLFETLQGVS